MTSRPKSKPAQERRGRRRSDAEPQQTRPVGRRIARSTEAAADPIVRKASGEPSPRIARVFWSGRSQAVRLPKDFRVEDDELVISRRGKALVLEPRRVPVDDNGWPLDFWDLFGQLPSDFDVGEREIRAERSSPLDDE